MVSENQQAQRRKQIYKEIRLENVVITISLSQKIPQCEVDELENKIGMISAKVTYNEKENRIKIYVPYSTSLGAVVNALKNSFRNKSFGKSFFCEYVESIRIKSYFPKEKDLKALLQKTKIDKEIRLLHTNAIIYLSKKAEPSEIQNFINVLGLDEVKVKDENNVIESYIPVTDLDKVKNKLQKSSLYGKIAKIEIKGVPKELQRKLKNIEGLIKVIDEAEKELEEKKGDWILLGIMKSQLQGERAQKKIDEARREIIDEINLLKKNYIKKILEEIWKIFDFYISFLPPKEKEKLLELDIYEEILKYGKEKEVITPKEVQIVLQNRGIEMEYPQVFHYITQLTQKGLLEKIGRGQYKVVKEPKN